MSGIAFEQTDLVEAITDLLVKRGLARQEGYTLEWYINQNAAAGKQIRAIILPNEKQTLNKGDQKG